MAVHTGIEEYPLEDFLKQHEEHLARLSQTDEPELLTVDGSPCVIVQNAIAYKALRERLNLLMTAHLLQERSEASRRGDEVSAEEMFKEMGELIAQYAK